MIFAFQPSITILPGLFRQLCVNIVIANMAKSCHDHGHDHGHCHDIDSVVASILGWYELAWSGGSFEVSLRPGGHFFCPKFQSQARWELVLTAEKSWIVRIDWKKFGQYELQLDVSAKKMAGKCVSSANPDEDWRTASFKRPLDSTEVMLFGDGAGTEWMFQWEGGEFPVVFKGDGYNHFVCDKFPAHAHWSLTDGLLTIHWDKYGTYEMRVDGDRMAGHAKGQPENWRKARRTGALPWDGSMGKEEACEHDHH